MHEDDLYCINTSWKIYIILLQAERQLRQAENRRNVMWLNHLKTCQDKVEKVVLMIPTWGFGHLIGTLLHNNMVSCSILLQSQQKQSVIVNTGRLI